MKLRAVLLAFVGLISLEVAAARAGVCSSSMSWSPDSQWLSYTLITESKAHKERAGWLFDTSFDRELERPLPPVDVLQPLAGRATYQIWTTRRDGQSTALIEESAWPLSTPAWNTEGRSIAFCRFVPRLSGQQLGFPRGRLEVVFQDSLDHKRVLWSQSDVELDFEIQSALPHLRAAWTADGTSLAIPVPGREPAVVVIRTFDSKVLLTVPSAYCPSWSPDGARLAVIRKTGRSAKVAVADRRGEGFGTPRDIAPTGPFVAPVGWGADGRSVLLVSERMPGRSYEVDLVRRYLDSLDAIRTVPLVPGDASHRATLVRGIAIDFDREGDHCVFAVDYLGRDSAIVTALPSERQILRPFHPLDVSQRIGAVTLSPDGQTIAARFGPPEDLTPPAVCDWTSEVPTTLFVPSRAAKRMWSTRLANLTRSLLAAGLPKVVVGGQVAQRPTLLPLPGELSSENPVSARITRIARLGATLDRFDAGHSEPALDASNQTADLEKRLFFHYLAGDYGSAATALDALEGRMTEPAHRLAALGIKAQVLWAQGDRSRAQSIIDYVQAAYGVETRRVEDTPFGPVITKELSSTQAWAQHLAQQVAKPEPSKPPDDIAHPNEFPEQPIRDSIIPPQPQPIEGRGGAAPLPPDFRRLDEGDR